MMRLFGSRQKNSKQAKDSQGPAEDRHFSTPIHAQHAIYTQHPTVNIPPLYPNSNPRDYIHQAEDQQWEVVSTHDDSRALAPSRASSLPPGASPPLPSPPVQRSPSPYSSLHTPLIKPASKDREPPQSANIPRKKQSSGAPVALGILRSLDPARQSEQQIQTQKEERSQISEPRHGEQDKGLGDKKERRAFWVSGKDRNKEKIPGKDRGREKEARDDNELTRMIGFLTATASEDWMLVLEVCDRASANENNAKEAVRALRREFKYGEPPAQLSAARLWAIMSRNCSEVFASEIASRKFLSTLEELVASHGTLPVVRERLLDVIAAAAYNSPKDSSIRSLWRKIKPTEKPEEGVPFDVDDSMINPPTSLQNGITGFAIQYPTSTTPAPVFLKNTLTEKRSVAKDRIIPPEEDIRRLFQECHIGMGNAALLSDALGACKPERLKTDAVIKEFYAKCRSSQELIYGQIPWATAGAEHSRSARGQLPEAVQGPHAGDLDGHEGAQTTGEKLLGELLKANEELLFVLKQYEDLERVAVERKTEDISRKVTRMIPRVG
ncbi:hypothetical protein AX15_007767 [Amanita polypyramis BW_CC]|nr:hypothetical protein AX15_007767 [Amanita polypyramis BW_CC]